MPKYHVSDDEYVYDGSKPVLTLRWGCECCKDTSPLDAEEIVLRDKVVKALNHYDAMHLLLKRAHKYGMLPWVLFAAVGRLLERIEK